MPMTDDKKTADDYRKLQLALDTYGADVARWPAHLSQRLAPALQADVEAQRLLREAAALDRVLDQAPARRPADVSELADRIAAAAVSAPRSYPKALTTAVAYSRIGPRPSRATPRAAGLAMAASLALGILAGQSNTIGDATAEFLTSALETTSQVASSDAASTLLDEDFL
jgi:hypothetical protein